MAEGYKLGYQELKWSCQLTKTSPNLSNVKTAIGLHSQDLCFLYKVHTIVKSPLLYFPSTCNLGPQSDYRKGNSFCTVYLFYEVSSSCFKMISLSNIY